MLVRSLEGIVRALFKICAIYTCKFLRKVKKKFWEILFRCTTPVKLSRGRQPQAIQKAQENDERDSDASIEDLLTRARAPAEEKTTASIKSR